MRFGDRLRRIFAVRRAGPPRRHNLLEPEAQEAILVFVDHNNTVAVQAQGGVVDLQRLARMALILGGAARAVEQQVAREQAQVAAAAAQLAEAAPAAPDA